jgi:dihydropteroate synthase
MILKTRARTIQFPRRPLIMGILNINDDSFSGDGKVDWRWALNRAAEMVGEGADIIDVGAESARTNRDAISESEELKRLRPFLEGFQEAVSRATSATSDQVFPPLLSINTWRPEVAKGALSVAGDILNDMGGLPTPGNAITASAHGAALLIMHTVGAPKVAHTHVGYRDVVAEMQTFFEDRIRIAKDAGLDAQSIILDPGIDFAKQRDDNLRVMRELAAVVAMGHPVLMPVSRKTVIGDVLKISDAWERDAGTIACLVSGALRGAAIFRVHNVAAALRSTLTLDRIKAESG